MYLSKAHYLNLSRFRLGAWKLNVNNIITFNSLTEVVIFVVTVFIEVSGLWKMKSILFLIALNITLVD